MCDGASPTLQVQFHVLPRTSCSGKGRQSLTSVSCLLKPDTYARCNPGDHPYRFDRDDSTYNLSLYCPCLKWNSKTFSNHRGIAILPLRNLDEDTAPFSSFQVFKLLTAFQVFYKMRRSRHTGGPHSAQRRYCWEDSGRVIHTVQFRKATNSLGCDLQIMPFATCAAEERGVDQEEPSIRIHF